jgi:hypothetical protein
MDSNPAIEVGWVNPGRIDSVHMEANPGSNPVRIACKLGYTMKYSNFRLLVMGIRAYTEAM